MMIQSRQEYTKNMVICPYLDPERTLLVYRFEDGKTVEITYTENLLNCLGVRFKNLSSKRAL